MWCNESRTGCQPVHCLNSSVVREQANSLFYFSASLYPITFTYLLTIVTDALSRVTKYYFDQDKGRNAKKKTDAFGLRPLNDKF